METNLVEKIAEKAQALPVELRRKALRYIESLEQAGTPAKPFRSVKGVLEADLTKLEQDLREVRAEAWRNFPREEPR